MCGYLQIIYIIILRHVCVWVAALVWLFRSHGFVYIVFGRNISLVLWTHQISLHKNCSCVLHRQSEHLFALVILLWSAIRIYTNVWHYVGMSIDTIFINILHDKILYFHNCAIAAIVIKIYRNGICLSLCPSTQSHTFQITIDVQ